MSGFPGYRFAGCTVPRAARRPGRVLLVLLLLMLSASAITWAAPPPLPLDGHVLDALPPGSTRLAVSKGAEALSITVVLRRDDEAGFQRLLTELNDPKSPNYERYLTPAAQAERFGPTASSVAALTSFLQAQGLSLLDGSSNRLTLTFVGSRDAVERAFAVRIKDFQSKEKSFFANTSAPALPRELAGHVQAVIGLNNLGEPQPVINAIAGVFDYIICSSQASINVLDAAAPGGFRPPTEAEKKATYDACVSDRKKARAGNSGGAAASGRSADVGASPKRLGAGNWQSFDGTGQRIAIIGFDSFLRTDVENQLALLGRPASQINQLSRVAVNGGATLGATQTETLLDIMAALSVAPGAQVVVYDTPFSGAGSFQTLLNAAIGGDADVISNSWAYCENQTTLADVQSIESVVQSAAVAGISVLSASGDTGSTCLNGAANTIVVPAGAPTVTAVGGSSLTLSPGSLYGSETWWGAGSSSGQPSGQGGFGLSRFFARPAFQSGLNNQAQRSIPDVVADADPENGVVLCQASDGGCPTGKLYGGTSVAAPVWAGYVAVLNQARGSNLGALNARLYPQASSGAFFSAASMGSDFAHVGLGSPNVNRLHLALNGLSVGPATAADSEVYVVSQFADAIAGRGIPADGSTPLTVVVRLRDANGNPVPGKSVSLAASPPQGVDITPASAVSSAANGAVEFSVRTRVTQALTFTATNVTDGFVISETAQQRFSGPAATSGSISAFPNQVAANGTSSAIVQVVLRDASGLPAPNKLVRIVQDGSAVISGPTPALTNAFGLIDFNASNIANQTVTFSAFNVTDGNLPIPVAVGGSNVVQYSNSPNTTCVGTPPVPASGFVVTPFATGFVSEVYSFGNVNFGCSGSTNPAFDAAGNVYASSVRQGDVFRFGPDGGAATSALSRLGPTLGQPVFGPDGKLYATRVATTGNFNTGDIIEISPSTGALLRVVAANRRCPLSSAIDPLSGDLFFTGGCFGAGSDDPNLYRITDPGDTNPNVPTAVQTYITLPNSPNGQVAFAPNGDIYVSTGYTLPAPPVVRVSRTNQPQPATLTLLPGVSSIFQVVVGAVNADGTARTLLVLTASGARELELANPASFTDIASNIGVGTIGPDGCMYAGSGSTMYQIRPAVGPCTFRPASSLASILLSPAQSLPAAVQGGLRQLSARVVNRVVPAGATMLFTVNGANPQLGLVNVGTDGVAQFTWQGVRSGRDEVRASALGLDSNRATVDWLPGLRSTALSFNGQALGGAVGGTLTLAATLSDVSVQPSLRINGVLVSFDLDGRTCNATTNAAGLASCTVIAPVAGNFTLTASFAGNAQYTASSATTRLTTLFDSLFGDGFEGL